MSPKRVIQRLHDIVAQDLANLAPNTILPDGRGFQVFEIYGVQPEQGLWRVVKRGEPVAKMANIKNAVSWCVADKYQQHRLGNDIMSLDQRKIMLENDMRARQHLARSPRKHTSAEALDAKLAARRYRLEDIDQRLAKCINVAKYWQLRGFNNETARTGRTTPHRTHR